MEVMTRMIDDSVEVLLLLLKSMLNLSAEETLTASPQHEKKCKKMHICCSGTPARRRRQRVLGQKSSATPISATKPLRSILRPKLLQNRLKGYVKSVESEGLLTHTVSASTVQKDSSWSYHHFNTNRIHQNINELKENCLHRSTL
uniref:Uncharacterized protein n=1 Tax=Solanum lycopersicum TaxID=4081 RepID=A0A3Q7FPZ6_SOLLC